MTPNQVVAYNLRRARALHGWTQEAAAERLEPHLGERWSRVVYSAAERSVSGQRIRHFTADNLVAFAATFELPVTFFLEPPRDVDGVASPGASEALPPEALAELVRGDVDARVDVLKRKFARRLEEDFGMPVIYTPREGQED